MHKTGLYLGEILMGTIPDMLSAIQSDSNPDIIVPGSLSIAYMEMGEWNVKDVLMHDGSKLSQVKIHYTSPQGGPQIMFF